MTYATRTASISSTSGHSEFVLEFVPGTTPISEPDPLAGLEDSRDKTGICTRKAVALSNSGGPQLGTIDGSPVIMRLTRHEDCEQYELPCLVNLDGYEFTPVVSGLKMSIRPDSDHHVYTVQAKPSLQENEQSWPLVRWTHQLEDESDRQGDDTYQRPFASFPVTPKDKADRPSKIETATTTDQKGIQQGIVRLGVPSRAESADVFTTTIPAFCKDADDLQLSTLIADSERSESGIVKESRPDGYHASTIIAASKLKVTESTATTHGTTSRAFRLLSSLPIWNVGYPAQATG